MPIFNISSSNLLKNGPTMDIKIGISLPEADFYRKTQQLQLIKYPITKSGLIDTGASISCISQDVVQSLSLESRGFGFISTPSHQKVQCQIYDISLFLGPIRINSLMVFGVPLAGQNIHCLIGRDVLKFGLFIYNGLSNQFTLSI